MTDLVKFDHLANRISTFVEPVKGLLVRDASENAMAKGTLVAVKALGKEIEALRVVMVAPHLDASKAINARAKELLAPIEAAETQIKKVMAAFANAEQARINEERREAEERAAAERKRLDEERMARLKKEMEDRKRLEDEARAAQVEREKIAKAEAAFGVEDPAAVAQREADAKRQKMEREAKEQLLVEEKRVADQRALREREIVASRLKADERRLAAAAPKNMTTQWKFEVVERLEVPMEYWTIDESKLGQAVRGGARDIPGVKIWSEQAVVAR